MSRLLPAFAVASMVVIAAQPVQAKVSKKNAREAKGLDKVGKTEYRKGNFGDAIIAFEAAFDANPLPKYLYNLAKAHDKAGNLDESIDAYDRYLDSNPNATDAEDIAAVLTFMRTKLRRSRGQVEIT